MAFNGAAEQRWPQSTAFPSTRPRTVSHDDLGWQTNLPVGGLPALHEVDQHGGGTRADLATRLADRGQGGIVGGGELDVVEARDRDFVRHGNAGRHKAAN